MPFDPTLPVNSTLVKAAELRGQFNGLKELIDALAPTFGRVASDWSSTSMTFTDVPGLAFPVAAGQSCVADCVLHVLSGTSGQGLRVRVSGPGAAGVLIAITGTGSSSSTTSECEVQTAFSVASPAKSFVTGSALTGVVRVHVAVTGATAAGTVQLQAANSSGGSAVTIKAGSNLVARRQ